MSAPGQAAFPFEAAQVHTDEPALPFAQRIIAWQRRHGRNGLPWQRTRDAYRVWLSEIMLQQTQVATVLGYYERFLQRFPTVAALAEAPSQEVLALWSGLGYYARARNLHRCAQVVVTQYEGRFPETAAQLAGLPGIGRSTAAAIAAFCFGERVAILDGNVKRVLTRLLAFEGDLSLAASEKTLWSFAHDFLPHAAAGPALDEAMSSYTQGLMDLGATVCTLRRPACDACPVSTLCRGFQGGAPERFPIKTRKLKRSRRASVLLWLQHRDRVWLVRRAEVGVWAQLWSLPEFGSALALERAVEQWPGTLEWMAPFKHVLTHFDWALQPLKLQWHGTISPAQAHEIAALPALDGSTATVTESGAADGAPASQGRWVTLAELDTLGIPAPIHKLLRSAL